jgi:glycine cleavage system transcriptional repressor
MYQARVTVSCPDRPGLLASVTARLFDLGVNLGATSCSAIGDQGEFSAVVEVPEDVDEAEVRSALEGIGMGGTVQVERLAAHAEPEPLEHVTHRFEFQGRDRPGLVARLAEGFAEFGANIVRMESERSPGGGEGDYVMRFECYVPAERVDACLAAAVNTAEAMGLQWSSKAVHDGGR